MVRTNPAAKFPPAGSVILTISLIGWCMQGCGNSLLVPDWDTLKVCPHLSKNGAHPSASTFALDRVKMLPTRASADLCNNVGGAGPTLSAAG